MEKTAPSLFLGSAQLCSDLISLGVDVVEEMHQNISQTPASGLNLVPGLGSASAPIFKTQSAISSLVYQGIGWLPKTISQTLNQPSAPAISLDTTSAKGVDAIAAINGAIGSHLDQTNNPLSLEMTLLRNGKPLKDTENLAGRKVCIFVHGLCSSENIWHYFSKETWGSEGQSYTKRLREDHGYDVLHIRYNTGKHISNNGQALSKLLNRLDFSNTQELNLVGHSMGGLVIRSACHYAKSHNHCWQDHLDKTICIGSPHGGAPLERAAHLGIKALGIFSSSAPLANIANFRSEGIKDLRYGYIQDEEWQSHNQDHELGDKSSYCDFIDSAKHGVIGASLSDDLAHWSSALIGDGLVPVQSALGEEEKTRSLFDASMKAALPSINHLHLTNHPEVYKVLESFLVR